MALLTAQRPTSRRPATPSPLALVACPDARPPAYQAAAGLARSGGLGALVTGYYYGGRGPLTAVARDLVPCRFAAWRKALMRRHQRGIPAHKVVGVPEYDVSLAVERRLGVANASRLARLRTDRFDRRVAREVERRRPDAALVFSDVGSAHTLPACRRLGIPAILSMVHGEVVEERDLLRSLNPREVRRYLGGPSLDLDQLAWLHARRLRDLDLADLVLVPSDHIAARLAERGLPTDKVRVVPYAADTRRFRPVDKTYDDNCVFLFAGAISERKGVADLLAAWRAVRRPGWRLQLLGAPPGDPSMLAELPDDVQLLGRVAHAEVPAAMAAADVFVFPSLFEGSAVVTYEALASGLPCVVTSAAGSVARDGVEGFVVPGRDPATLADRLRRLGSDPVLRRSMAAAARRRAEAFTWDRYRASIVGAVDQLVGH